MKTSLSPQLDLSRSVWIGGPGNAFCRHEFTLPCRPVRARLRMAADPHSYAIAHWQIPVGPFQYEHSLLGGSLVKYRVFVNGVLAAVGPFRPLQDGVPVVQDYDVTPWLGRDANVLAVLSRGEKNGFALVLEVDCADGSRHTIRSGAHWKQEDANAVFRPVCWECQAIDHFSKGGPGPGEYPEHMDGLAYPQGWKRPGFDDRGWRQAQGFGPVTQDCECCENLPYQITRVAPESVRSLGQGNYLVDFGRAVFAGIEMTGPAGGGAVELRLAEELLPNGHARYLLRTENCYQERWTFAPDSEPLSHLGLRMFRYAEIEGWQGRFDSENIAAIAVTAPFDFSRSAFRCSDAGLEQVWQLCKNSVAYATADIYTDCLTRERLAYEADAYVTMLTQFAVEGNFQTAKRTLAYLVGHPNWPCEWRQFFIPLFYEYFLHTGDEAFLAEHYDFLCESSLHPLMQDGLIRQFPRECIVDWPPSCRDDFDFRDGNAVANAYAYWDLDLLSILAGWLGREADAVRFREVAEELREGFNRHLFDEKTGLYVDGLGSRHSSLHANMFALRFGLIPEARRKSCLDFVISKGMACSVFASQFLLEALFLHGEDRAAVTLMASGQERSWLEMIREGATVTTESWLTDAKPNMSWAHPWGSAPANIIVRHLFGLRPTAPGWKDYGCDPRPGGLESGQLTVTTPRGVMKASFRRSADGYQCTFDPDASPEADGPTADSSEERMISIS